MEIRNCRKASSCRKASKSACEMRRYVEFTAAGGGMSYIVGDEGG
jgi:hypothetical protein